jgi:predicted enzyme related to lactoylglutathione lyase
MESAGVSAVLFVKDLKEVTTFYSQALGMTCVVSDEYHSSLDCRGFNLIVHQIPKHMTDGEALGQPPERRVEAAIRLNFPVRDISEARRVARRLGGQIDDAPPEWADSQANVFLGHDPEGNVFKVS